MSVGGATSVRDRGLTLIEMLVAISILAIAMTLVVTLVVNVSRTFSREEALNDSSSAAALGMQHITRIVRAGAELDTATGERDPAFAVATPAALTVSGYIGVQNTTEGPTRIELVLDTARDQLTERRFSSYRSSGIWLFRTTPTSTRVLVRNVTDSTVFSYRRANGTSLPARTLTATERREIAAVRVSFAVQTDETGRAEAARLEALVSLPNLELTRTAP